MSLATNDFDQHFIVFSVLSGIRFNTIFIYNFKILNAKYTKIFINNLDD